MKSKQQHIVYGFILFFFSWNFSVAAVPEKSLTIAVSQEFDTLHPYVNSMLVGSYIYRMVNRTLTSIDADANVLPQIAKQIPTIENGLSKFFTDKGQKKILANWEILEGVKWNDGTPVTCADFAFAKKVIDSKNVSVNNRSSAELIEKIEWNASSPKKCQITYSKLEWDYNQMAGFFALPSHLEGPIFEKYKDENQAYERHSWYSVDPLKKGLYMGPYQVKNYKLGDSIELEPNPFYFSSAPKIKNVIIKVIGNTATLDANLQSGTVNMISSIGLTLDQALDLSEKMNKQKLPFEVQFVNGFAYEYCSFNLDWSFLQDIEIRRAIVMAVNREEIVKSFFQGKAKVAHHFMSPKSFSFIEDPKKISVYPYSLKKAGEILDAKGWKMGKDGYRYKDNVKMSMEFSTTAGNKVRETIQAFIQDQLKKLGVETVIKNYPARVLFGDIMRKRKFKGIVMSAWTYVPNVISPMQFRSAGVPTEENGWSGSNYSGYQNMKMDQLLEAVRTEFDRNKRKKIENEIMARYTEDLPSWPLYYRLDNSVIPKEMKNFRLTGHGILESNEIEKWTL